MWIIHTKDLLVGKSLEIQTELITSVLYVWWFEIYTHLESTKVFKIIQVVSITQNFLNDVIFQRTWTDCMNIWYQYLTWYQHLVFTDDTVIARTHPLNPGEKLGVNQVPNRSYVTNWIQKIHTILLLDTMVVRTEKTNMDGSIWESFFSVFRGTSTPYITFSFSFDVSHV